MVGPLIPTDFTGTEARPERTIAIHKTVSH